MQGEVAELFDAWRRKEETIGEEIADVAIYLFSLAQMLGLNLEEEIVRKISINEGRRYVEHNGSLVKVSYGLAVSSVAESQSLPPNSKLAPIALLLPFPSSAAE